MSKPVNKPASAPVKMSTRYCPEQGFAQYTPDEIRRLLRYTFAHGYDPRNSASVKRLYP